MKIILSPRAEKQLRKLPKIDQIAVAQKIRAIGSEEKIVKKEKLEGFSNIFRVRVGNYRIVYRKTKAEILYHLNSPPKRCLSLIKTAFRIIIILFSKVDLFGYFGR